MDKGFVKGVYTYMIDKERESYRKIERISWWWWWCNLVVVVVVGGGGGAYKGIVILDLKLIEDVGIARLISDIYIYI